MTVTCCFLSWRISSQTRCLAWGSSPVVGSSRSRIWGLLSRARAMISRRFMPVERAVMGAFCFSSIWKNLSCSLARLRASFLVRSKYRAYTVRFLMTVKSGSRLSSWGATPTTALISRLWVVAFLFVIQSSPEVGRRKQYSMRMVVVLPAPFGPRKPMHSPLCTSKSMWSTAVKVLYVLVNAFALIRVSLGIM